MERELERGTDIHIALTDATPEFMIALNYESRFGTARDVRNPGAYARITATKRGRQQCGGRIYRILRTLRGAKGGLVASPETPATLYMHIES